VVHSASEKREKSKQIRETYVKGSDCLRRHIYVVGNVSDEAWQWKQADVQVAYMAQLDREG